MSSYWTSLYNPWTLYQTAIIAGCFLIAWLVGRWLEPRLEDRIRKIRGHPGLLRTLAAILRRLTWIIAIPLLWIAKELITTFTWPSRAYFVSVALGLSIAWIAAAVLSRVVRNRTLARIVAWAIWLCLALTIVGLVGPVAQALDSLAFGVGDFRISFLNVLKGITLIVALLWVATLTGNFIENRLNMADDITPSLRVLLSKLIKITLFTAAVLFSISSTGIDLTALTIFSGAVGVGIGFGLQKVVSNFISGIIILLDKSIKPGDTISLGETFGWIRELRARFISVITRDGKEYLIPNEDFITQQVVNWSFSDKLVRLDVPFGVAYDSDPHRVTELAIEACSAIDRVSSDKNPVCWMTAFGDSSLDFVLRFWISDPQNGVTNIRGKVLIALWDAFKENGVGIPFPHREIIMRSPVQIARPDPESD